MGCSMFLITGGLGYIGSHIVVQLLSKGSKVAVLDNLSNSKLEVVNRICQLTNRTFDFIHGDIRDGDCLSKLFINHQIETVIHCAGLKAVGESETNPILYYDNNVNGTLNLFNVMATAGVKKIVFSSSATVYGNPCTVHYTENTSTNPVNVYGRTKLIVEQMLRDIKKSDPIWRIALLRYFNPVGSHASGLIGEDPLVVPNNLMPFIAQVAVGKREKLTVFGGDYPTPDGTGLRDYIHVEDLARGHLAALDFLSKKSEMLTVNLGTGRPYSVLEVVKAFERASGRTIPYEFAERRVGDLAEYYADPSLAKSLLGWSAEYGLDRMCEDTWRWQSMNPNGY